MIKIFTDSRIVAETISGEEDHHSRVRTIIDRCVKDSSNFMPSYGKEEEVYRSVVDANIIFIKTTHKNKNGSRYKVYEMNRNGYLYLLLKLNMYDNADFAQLQFIKVFSLLNKKYVKNSQLRSDFIKESQEQLFSFGDD